MDWLNLLAWLRRLWGDDAAEAAEAECATVDRALARPASGFEAEMCKAAAKGGPTVLLGAACGERPFEVRVPLAHLSGGTHSLVTGGTGSGKTRLVCAVIRSALEACCRDPSGGAVVVVDHKDELAGLSRDLAERVAAEAPVFLARPFLEGIVHVDPFSPICRVPMQVLEPIAGTHPEAQAYDLASMLDRTCGGLGEKQGDFAYMLFLLGIDRRLSLPRLCELLDDPQALVAEAARCGFAQVRAFFDGRNRLTAASFDGMRARLRKLLRLPETRQMLAGPGCMSFGRMFDRASLCVVNVGASPGGCEDIGQFWAALFALRLSRSVMARPHAAGQRPVLVVSDEWQEGLAGDPQAATTYERMLMLARSRGVSFMLVTQSLAMAAKVSASLPKVVATNVDVQALFKCSPEDAHALRPVLPVTGRRPRPAPPPWEAERRPYLTEEEELRQLEKEASNLPKRHFFFKNGPWPAALVRTADVDIPEGAWRQKWRKPAQPQPPDAPVFEDATGAAAAAPEAAGAGPPPVFEPADEPPAPKRMRPR